MPKVHWIAHVHVTDPDEYRKYVEGARKAFEVSGARFLARGGRHAEVEGALGRGRHARIEFPRLAAALDCYQSPAYQAARRFRSAAGVATVVLVEGA